jgi:hypothetical protein
MIKIYETTKVKPDVEKYFLQVVEKKLNFQFQLVDKDGVRVPSSTLLHMNRETGKLYLFSSINRSLGLGLSADGKLSID